MPLKRPTAGSKREVDVLASSLIAQQGPPRHPPTYAWGHETPLEGSVKEETFPAVDSTVFIPLQVTDTMVAHKYAFYVTTAFANTLQAEFQLYKPSDPYGTSLGSYNLYRIRGTQSEVFSLVTTGLRKISTIADFTIKPGFYYIGLRVFGTGALGKLAATTDYVKRTKLLSQSTFPASVDFNRLTDTVQINAAILSRSGDIHISSGTFSPLIDEDEHKTLLHLIHFIDEGPGDGFATGATKTVTGGLFPTLVTWARGDSTTLVTKAYTYNGTISCVPDTITWTMYDTDGSTILATVSDAISYSGVCETGRVRTIT